MEMWGKGLTGVGKEKSNLLEEAAQKTGLTLGQVKVKTLFHVFLTSVSQS